MAKISWDKASERYFETGVSHGVLYPMTKDDTTGKYEYDTGVAWNGLTSVSESPDGAEPNDLYADNIKYATLRSAETFGATIEAYTFPEEFYDCDGTTKAVGGVYVGQQSRKPFGLCYRTEVGSDTMAFDSEDGYKLHIIYNATVSPSDRSYETVNDSPDAITLSWEMTTTPINVGEGASDPTVYASYKPTSTVVIDSSKLDSAGKTKLAALEAILYGSGTTAGTNDPRLPMPWEIIEAMT